MLWCNRYIYLVGLLAWFVVVVVIVVEVTYFTFATLAAM